MRVLLVEDSEKLQRSLTRALRKSGYAVDSALDGEVALQLANRYEYDVIILDLLLPRLDGWEVLRRLREEENPARVLILSARDQLDDRVVGLRGGADDYLTKPFELEELLARVEALLRRRYEQSALLLTVGDLHIDTGAKLVQRDGCPVELSAREYALLLYLALRQGEIVTRGDLTERFYDEESAPESNAIDAAICKLRTKISPPGTTALIHTRRGLGYILAAGD